MAVPFVFPVYSPGSCVLPQSVWVGFTRRWGRGAVYSPHFCIMQRKRKEGHYSFAALGRSCRAQGGAASQCLKGTKGQLQQQKKQKTPIWEEKTTSQVLITHSLIQSPPHIISMMNSTLNPGVGKQLILLGRSFTNQKNTFTPHL